MRYFYSFLFSVFAVSALHAEIETEVAVVESLSTHMASMKSLTASFDQRMVDDRGESIQDARGLVKFKQPRFFYWKTSDPYEQLLLTDGKILWVYDIDLEQISKKPFLSDEDSAPALLLSGDIEKLSRLYSIERAVTGDKVQFNFSAFDNQAVFVNLNIVFLQNILHSMSFKDNFDHLTTVDFSDIVINEPIGDSEFEFSPPAGVDIIDETDEVELAISTPSL